MTNEPESLVEKAVEKKRMKFPVAMVKSGEENNYGILGFPTSYLVGVDGTILWKGHPGTFEREFGTERLEEELAHTVQLPAVPESYAKSVKKSMKVGNISKTYEILAKKAKRVTEDEELSAFLEAIESHVNGCLEQAGAAEEEGDYARAFTIYGTVVSRFSSVPGYDDAKAALTALGRNKQAKVHIDGSKKWESAMKAWRKGDFEGASGNRVES